DSFAWALGAVEPGGRVIAMTSFPSVRGYVEQRHLVENELTILGSRYATLREVQLAVELVASGRVQPVIGLTTPPSGVPEIHRRLRSGQVVGRAAIRWTGEGALHGCPWRGQPCTMHRPDARPLVRCRMLG